MGRPIGGQTCGGYGRRLVQPEPADGNPARSRASCPAQRCRWVREEGLPEIQHEYDEPQAEDQLSQQGYPK